MHKCIDDMHHIDTHYIGDSASVSLRYLQKSITFYWRFKRTFSDTEFLEIDFFKLLFLYLWLM